MKRKLIAFFTLVCIVVFTCCSALAKELSAEEIFSRLSVSTVEILASDDYHSSIGSGFYIDDKGTVVTNYHVVDGCTEIAVRINDGGVYPVKSVLGYDKTLDIVILSTSRQNTVPVKMREGAVATGETVYALGSSLGLTGTFSQGIVSAANRELDGMTYIQISAPISSGNSGGPLIDSKGNVIGITTAGFENGQNLNLAIPISYISKISRSKEYSITDFNILTAEKVLTVLIEDDFPPFSDVNNGICYGIHVDIAKELAHREGWTVKFVPTTWEGLFTVNSYPLSIAFGIDYTPERDETFDFSVPYYENMRAIFNAKSNNRRNDRMDWYIINRDINEMVTDGTIKRILSRYGL